MFGNNPIRPVEKDGRFLSVQEIFHTLQGEGPYAGMPSLFIRLAGCNLACHFCDTEFESKVDEKRGVFEVAEQIERDFSPEQRKFVVLTGGEPMRQNFMPLLGLLFAMGTKLVQIETAGTLWVDGLEKYLEAHCASDPAYHGPLVDIVCSPKTPQVNINIRAYCQHWKYIVRQGEADPVDGLPRRGTQLSTMDKTQVLFRPPSVRDAPHEEGETVWLSPCDEYDAVKNKANMDEAVRLCLQHGYRLSLQVHKIVNLP